MNLSDTILAVMPAKPETFVRWATVTQASPLLVQFPGDSASVAVSKLAGYTPTLNAQTVLLKAGSRFIAMGEL